MPLPSKLPDDFDKHVTRPEKLNTQLIARRYCIEKRIGSGNFGTAFLVQDQAEKNEKQELEDSYTDVVGLVPHIPGANVYSVCCLSMKRGVLTQISKVLKQITVGPIDPGETVDAMREAKLLSQMKHKNIVQFHDSFLDGNYFCIIIEYCEGGDLDCKLQEQKKLNQCVPEVQVIKWMKQLLRAIDYMHRKRILHRDLKTKNIFLKENQMKIGDFGISRILLGASDKASTFVGTPYYMSPEVLKHDQYDEKCDIWSLGCVLYEICCYEHAFDGGTLMSVMMKIVSDHTPCLPEIYSRGLNNVLESMLDRNPDKRQTASRILRHPAFESCIESERHLTARDRLRIKKQKEADITMQRLKEMAKLKVAENKKLRRESKERNFLKSSFDTNMQLTDVTLSDSKLATIEDDSDLELQGTVVFQPVDDQSGADDVIGQSTWMTLPSDVTVPGPSGSYEKKVEEIDHNSTDELIESLMRDGVIPEDADLADTFYSNHDDFEMTSSSDEDDVSLPDEKLHLSRSELVNLMGLMEGVLDLDDSTMIGPSTSQSPGQSRITEETDPETSLRKIPNNSDQNAAEKTVGVLSAFNTNMMDNKITKMREKCRAGLGSGMFQQGYEVMKEMRFDDPSYAARNSRIIERVKEMILDRNKCMDLEQLVYMEQQLNPRR